MSIKETLIDLGVVVVIAGAAIGFGFARGAASAHAADQSIIASARADTDTALGSLNASSRALSQLKAQLDQQAQDLQQQQVRTASLMHERDALQTQLAREAANRYAADRKAAHEDDACSNLDHLPICPLLSHRLFGTPAAKSSASDSTGHHFGASAGLQSAP